MKFRIKLIGGDEYIVEKNVADAAAGAMKTGGVANIGFALINGKSIAVIEDVEKAALLKNPILNDENWTKYLEGNMKSLDVLNNRYSGDKFQKEWEEALKYKRDLQRTDLSNETHEV